MQENSQEKQVKMFHHLFVQYSSDYDRDNKAISDKLNHFLTFFTQEHLKSLYSLMIKGNDQEKVFFMLKFLLETKNYYYLDNNCNSVVIDEYKFLYYLHILCNNNLQQEIIKIEKLSNK